MSSLCEINVKFTPIILEEKKHNIECKTAFSMISGLTVLSKIVFFKNYPHSPLLRIDNL
jgi:hypothetical protein